MITMNRLASHALLVFFILLTPLATVSEAFAAEPSPPTGLRAEVYSQRAAELFWDRPDAFGLRYEIRRDDMTLSTIGGVSFFDDTLAAGTAYVYAVIAIDRDGQRSAASSITLETIGGVATLLAPTGLRADVYSKTAIELFWNRPDAFGLRYEIRRDGTTLTTIDGVSFYDDTLIAGTTYEYRVRAIDREGRRSAASIIRVMTAGTASDDDPLAPDNLVAPEIERIAIYSGTAAELFWQRPVPDSPVARVEVSRDNLVLGTTDGTSFFDDSRSPGVDYQYTLVAIAADGQRSDDGAPDPGDSGDGLEVIRADNVVMLIAEVFDAYRGEPWGDIVFALPGFSRTPDLTPNEEQTLTCDNGGTVTIRGSTTGYGGYGYVFDNCQDGVMLFDGQVDNYGDRYGIQNVEGTGFTVTTPTETIRYTGDVSELPIAENLSMSLDAPVNFEMSSADGTLYSLAGAVTDFQYGPTPSAPWPTISLSGSFALSSGRTGGATLRAETPEALGRPTGYDPETDQVLDVPEEWTFTEGSLRVTAPDGSTVLLEADNGDDTSARLTLIDITGERTSFDEPWSVWQENLRFD